MFRCQEPGVAFSIGRKKKSEKAGHQRDVKQNLRQYDAVRVQEQEECCLV